MQKRNWATEDIYKNLTLWEADYKKVEDNADFSEFKGKLGDKTQFLACMKKQELVGRILEKLAVYTHMKHDEDTANSQYDALYSRIQSLSVMLSTNTAFITPELISLDKSVLEGYIRDPELSEYDYSLSCVLKEKEHVLDEEQEKLLASVSEVFSSFKDIFGKIDNADLKFGKVRVGLKQIALTHGTYGLFMHSDNRRLRQKAFKQYYKSYIDLINTITSTYYGNVKKGVAIAKVRNYDSALSRALGGEDVDVKVYQNLIDSVHTALPILHDYMATKKKQLGYREMHMYDVYASTVKDADYKLSYDDAYSLVVEGLAVLGDEYKELLLKAYNERWIDVDEKPNKRSGAYSISAFDSHPYVLLNYQPTTHDVFTIAHEMGHSIHSYYSNKTQPYAKADYKIFVAEVASTVNEVLLVKYLISKAKDKKQEKFLLSYLMEMIRTTLFRQTQFAEFEEFAHSSVEKGIPLTKDLLNEKYLELNKKYYGDAVISDNEISYEWARIPHFYRAFYVYKYSTGIISALAIAERILNEGQPAIDDYFNFLKSGNSNGPVELLKIAGVDLTDKKPFELAFKAFSDALNRYKQL